MAGAMFIVGGICLIIGIERTFDIDVSLWVAASVSAFGLCIAYLRYGG